MPAGAASGGADPARIELWLADLDALARPLEEIDAADPLLTPGERLLSGARRCARMALRLLIGRVFGREAATRPFVTAAYGKPSLPGLGGDFNLAHTDTQALIGLGTVSAIGVDLELQRPLQLDMRRRLAIADAGVRVAAGAELPAGDEVRTLQAWTRLEAFAKAGGMGIGRTLAELGVWGRPGGGTASGSGDGSRDSLIVHDVDAGAGFRAAVALPRGSVPPQAARLPNGVEALCAVRDGAARRPQIRR